MTFLTARQHIHGVLALLAAALLLVSGAVNTPPAKADERTWHHAVSLVNPPKYAEDFKHFGWVNPNAPKGGRIRMDAFGSFDSFNLFSIKGETAAGLGLIYDSLMATSPDEASTEYGLIAEAISFPDDFSSATFRLRPEARFHDGTPITSADVVFSLDAQKKAHPLYAAYYKNVVSAEANGPHEVTFKFNVKGNRELPQIVGQLTILPKHFWTGPDDKGEPRDLSKSSLDVPLGSGPYKIKDFTAGRNISFERVKDYWAKDLPVSIGQWNFDEVSFEFFRDQTVAFEAFKAGQIDLTRETSSKNWSTGYDFAAVKEGKIKRSAFREMRVARMQAFILNLRREQFSDPRVRHAFNLAFDFEWSNKNLFYGLYKRVNSYFDNSELAARDLPTGLEKEILEEVRDQIPPEAFTTPYENPTNSDARALRNNLRKASTLLREAGYVSKGGRLAHKQTGKPLKVEIMLVDPQFERIVLPYVKNLNRLGIQASARVIDSAQYQRRVESFDYDLFVSGFSQSESPGNEQRDFWGSAAADRNGSRNLIGIKNPAIDKLIDRVIFAKDRAELVAATRALDRVLLWNHYVVPQWYNPDAWIAHWDMFSFPEPRPSRSISVLQTWWYDPEKATAIGRAPS